jgi:hypothetical protein
MLTGQTTIKRVVARCPARAEPLLARMRLSHLLRGADLTPPCTVENFTSEKPVKTLWKL